MSQYEIDGLFMTSAIIKDWSVSPGINGRVTLRAVGADAFVSISPQTWAAIIPELYALLPDDLKYQVLREVDGG